MRRLVVAATACSTCPYRRDTPGGVWDRTEYEKLKLYDVGHETPLGNVPELHTFICHHSAPRGPGQMVCRGWLSVHRDHPAVRLAACLGKLDLDDIPTADESSVYYGSGTEAAEAGLREVAKPTRKAREAIVKILVRKARKR